MDSKLFRKDFEYEFGVVYRVDLDGCSIIEANRMWNRLQNQNGRAKKMGLNLNPIGLCPLHAFMNNDPARMCALWNPWMIPSSNIICSCREVAGEKQ